MSKVATIFAGLAAVAICAAGTYYYCTLPARDDAIAHIGRGLADPILILPAKSRPEERILRHPQADGSALDDVDMRDGTTKHIVYDTRMSLRQVQAFYKAPEGQKRGPLKYEKTHDANGHLATERHLRLDGTLEMDGHFQADGTYVRHLYFSAADLTPAAAEANHSQSSQSNKLVVSAEDTFDKWWHPIAHTEFRPDATKKLTRTWGDGLDQTVTNFADDGVKILDSVTTGRGKYYTAIYYPDGVNIRVEALNTYDGTTFQWYRLDHSLEYKLTYTNSNSDVYVIADKAGTPMVRQVWLVDYDTPEKNGVRLHRLDHLDHFNAEGKVDSRYDFDSTSHKPVSYTIYKGEDAWGPRLVYTIGDDGWATTVRTYDGDGSTVAADKPVTHEQGVHVALEPWMLEKPEVDVPALPSDLHLHGQMYWFGYGR